MNIETPRLHATQQGAGPDVMFLHGLDSDSTVWSRAVDLLASDHRCICVDLPGHGKSFVSTDPASYSREAVLNDIDEVLTTMSGPITLVGHSLGGYLGMAHVLTRPGVIAGLVLVSTGPGFRDDSAREAWNDRVSTNAPKYGVSPTAASIAFHTDSMVIDRITEIEIPVALVIGSDDRAFLAANDYMEKKLPNVNRTTVAGARHYVMKSDPNAIADAVRWITNPNG